MSRTESEASTGDGGDARGGIQGLYIHVPFCRFKCYYCDFNTYAGIEGLIPQYVEAVCVEIRRWGEALADAQAGTPVQSVYFGGGTPSLLGAEQIAAVLDTTRSAFDIAPDAEVTIEANPESVDRRRAAASHAAGVTRVSMGAQAFDNEQLRALGRLHDASRIREAFFGLRAAGFDNISLDLMYGLPNQSMGQWKHSLEEALRLEPEHLSLYALTVEERTPFHRWIEVDRTMSVPDADAAADMYELAERELPQHGYVQYEISNWSRPARESRHNVMYWRNQPFLGVGPGAHSFLAHARFAVEAGPHQYLVRMTELERDAPAPTSIGGNTRVSSIADLRAIAPIATLDLYTEDAERRETLILGLRLVDGVSEREYATRFGQTPSSLFADELARGLNSGLLAHGADGRLRLTPRGRLLANEVFVDLLAPA